MVVKTLTPKEIPNHKEHLAVLAKHGYSEPLNHYLHGEHFGTSYHHSGNRKFQTDTKHSVTLGTDGNWQHSTHGVGHKAFEGVDTEGKTPHQLDLHLSKVHSSQHSEEEEAVAEIVIPSGHVSDERAEEIVSKSVSMYNPFRRS